MPQTPKPPRKPDKLNPGEIRVEVTKGADSGEIQSIVNQWLSEMYKKYDKFKIIDIKQSESQNQDWLNITMSIWYSRS